MDSVPARAPGAWEAVEYLAHNMGVPHIIHLVDSSTMGHIRTVPFAEHGAGVYNCMAFSCTEVYSLFHRFVHLSAMALGDSSEIINCKT